MAKPGRPTAREWIYVFRIDEVRAYYSYGVDRRDRESFTEHFMPEIKAECLFPRKLAGRTTELTIIGERDAQEKRPNPDYGVGTLTMRGQRSEFLGWLPTDALAHVMAMIASKHYRFIQLTGNPLQNGRAAIISLGFDGEFDLAQMARDLPELA